MKTSIQLYDTILAKVASFYEHLNLKRLEKRTGRPLSLSLVTIIALALFWKTANIATKKMVYEIFQPRCTYKTMVVNMNRYALVAAYILKTIWALNRIAAHPLKKTDTTDIPVCLNKNGKHHRTMRGLAAWGHSGKGWFYGLKLGLTTDLFDTMLGVIFASGNTDDRAMFRKVNENIYGVIVADAGHISEDLEKEFFIENKRILMIKPRKNMKKVITAFQYFIYNTRQRIELDFRNLKLFFGLVTSLPRSVDGYFANYLYSILAYVCA